MAANSPDVSEDPHVPPGRGSAVLAASPAGGSSLTGPA